MDEEKLQERACKLAEEEDVPVLPPFTTYSGFVKMNPDDIKEFDLDELRKELGL